MGLRYLLLGVGLWLLFVSIRRLIWLRREKQRAKRARHAMNMVACDYCGIHLPQSEAIRREEHHYCSKKHAELGKKSNDNKDK
jgi:uncharacterized protein